VGYYQGDYYRGDYYRGDPGFLSFLGKGLGAVGGFLPGVGGIVSKIGGALARVKSSGAMVRATETLAKGRAIVAKHPVLSAAGAAGVLTAGTLAGRRLARGRAVAPGMRRHKRMNPCNVKALRRAIRRAHGFEKVAKRVMRFSSPHKRKKFAGFKHAKKRA
jgi:hypothetical protein